MYPVQLAGYGVRKGALVSDVTHSIWIRVLVVEQDGAVLVLVSGEFLNWSTESDARFRAIVADETGASAADVLFSATHTHSAPALSHFHAPILGAVDERYLDLVATQLRSASREAGAQRRPVSVSQKIGVHDLAWQRRSALDLSVDPSPPRIDDRLTLVQFHDAHQLVACLVHYACHPVVSADHTVSGDYFGVGIADIERLTEAIVFPLQGCAGDVNPGEGVAMAGIERAAEIGHRFSDAIQDLLQAPATELITERPSATWTSAHLPLRAVPTPSQLNRASHHDGLEGDWARALLAYPELVRESIECRLQLWSLGPQLQLLGMSGEVTSEYGLRIRERSRGTTLPVAYCNGMVGYIPTARQIAAGGYEVFKSARCYLLSGFFDPAIENLMNDAVDRLLLSNKSSPELSS